MVLQVCTPLLPAFITREPTAALDACITAEHNNASFMMVGKGTADFTDATDPPQPSSCSNRRYMENT
jgi:hypothetical protein